MRAVYAFPFRSEGNAAPTAHYHGPETLFREAGFVAVDTTPDITVMATAPCAAPRRSTVESPRSCRARTAVVLPHALAVIYGLAHRVCEPAALPPWIAVPPGTHFFLFTGASARYTRFDVLANVLAYLPLGFLVVALVPRRLDPWGRFAAALAAGAALSFAMESLQMLLPPRDANVIDLLSNSVGAAFGGAFGIMFAYSARMRAAISGARHRWFLGGKSGDVGLALILVVGSSCRSIPASRCSRPCSIPRPSCPRCRA